MDDFIRKNKKLIIVFFVVGIAIPIITNLIFKLVTNHYFLNAEWTAGEFLGYCGSIYGAIATIVALYLTIDFNITNQREAKKLSIRPYLYINGQTLIKTDFEEIKKRNDVIYLYASMNAEDNFVDLTRYSNWDQLVKIERNPINSFRYFFTISNVGAGTAINLDININEEPINLIPLCVPKDKDILIYCVINFDHMPDDVAVLDFDFIYNDVEEMAQYQQKHKIKIENIKNNDYKIF